MSLEALKTFHSGFLKYIQYKDLIGKKVESFSSRTEMPSLKYGDDTCQVVHDAVLNFNNQMGSLEQYDFYKINTVLGNFGCTININTHDRYFDPVLNFNDYRFTLRDSYVTVQRVNYSDDYTELLKIPVMEFNNLSLDEIFQCSTIIDNFEELHKMFVYIQDYDMCIKSTTESLIGIGAVLNKECERLERTL